jgi:hypothetical protein
MNWDVYTRAKTRSLPQSNALMISPLTGVQMEL